MKPGEKPKSLPAILLACLILYGSDTPATDSFYGYSEGGVIHLTNVYSNYKFRLIFRDTGKEAVRKRAERRRILEIIEDVSTRYSVDPALVKAIVRAESDFDPYAVSRAGALGLMQLMPETADDLDVTNPFDPEENIQGGVRYLKHLMEFFDGDVRLALAAYNAGKQRIIKYGDVPPYRQTRRYIEKVMDYIQSYRRSGSGRGLKQP